MRCPRVRADSTHARKSVHLSKIENSSHHHELVYHPMSEKVDELSSLVRIKLQQTFSDSYKSYRSRVEDQVSFFRLRSTSFLH